MRRAWTETQAAFAAALLDPRLRPSENLVECGSVGQRRGFAIYRNNSLVSLIDALQERFPVTCELVGEEFFRAMARSYAAKHRPRSPILMNYGADFPAFIDSFALTDDVRYLSDIARLEAAWSEAYHAAEASPLQPQELTTLPPEALLEMKLKLHPSARLLRSAYPIAEIWAAHQHPGAVVPPAHWDPQDVLIVRPVAEVAVHALGPGLYAFISALSDSRHLQDAAELAVLDGAQFDVGENIVHLFRMGVVAALDADDTQEIPV